MGGISESLSRSRLLCLGVLSGLLLPGRREVGCVSVLLVHPWNAHLCQPMDIRGGRGLMHALLFFSDWLWGLTYQLSILAGHSSCAVHSFKARASSFKIPHSPHLFISTPRLAIVSRSLTYCSFQGLSAHPPNHFPRHNFPHQSRPPSFQSHQELKTKLWTRK
jgi:hypothetical protein